MGEAGKGDSLRGFLQILLLFFSFTGGNTTCSDTEHESYLTREQWLRK